MPHIRGKRLFLREYREEDFPRLRGWINNPDETANMSPIFDRVQSEAMTREFFESVVKNKMPGHYMIIADGETEEYIGQADLRTSPDSSRQACLAIVIPDPANRGKGYGREAMELLLDFGFFRLNLHKIWLQVFLRNETAIHLYRTLGFHEDGILREDVYREGGYLDLMVMSLLQREWRARQGYPAIEA